MLTLLPTKFAECSTAQATFSQKEKARLAEKKVDALVIGVLEKARRGLSQFGAYLQGSYYTLIHEINLKMVCICGL